MTSDKFLGQGLTYDDVLLVPDYSETLPRDVSLKSRFSKKYSAKHSNYICCNGYCYRK